MSPKRGRVEIHGVSKSKYTCSKEELSKNYICDKI